MLNEKHLRRILAYQIKQEMELRIHETNLFFLIIDSQNFALLVESHVPYVQF